MKDEPKTYITFEADFPDEAVWDEKGIMVLPNGKALMIAIAEGLKQQGLGMSEVVQHSFYGWSVEARTRDGRFWCMVQDIEPWLLIAEYKQSVWERIFGTVPDDAGMIDFLNRLMDVIQKDRRFRNPQQFTMAEYDRLHRNTQQPGTI